jgi:hypothetical protein
VDHVCRTNCAGISRYRDAQRPFVTRNAELLAMRAPQFEEEQCKNANLEKAIWKCLPLASAVWE